MAAMWHIAFSQHMLPFIGLVSTGMGHHLRVRDTFILSCYLSNHQGQLSLAVLPGWAEMSTCKSLGVSMHSCAPCNKLAQPLEMHDRQRWTAMYVGSLAALSYFIFTHILTLFLSTIYGTEWPVMCWCAVKNLLTHSTRMTTTEDSSGWNWI